MYDNKSLQNRLICGEIVPFFMMFLFVLYDKYVIGSLPKSIRDRCCDFKLLEEKCNEYNMKF